MIIIIVVITITGHTKTCSSGVLVTILNSKLADQDFHLWLEHNLKS